MTADYVNKQCVCYVADCVYVLLLYSGKKKNINVLFIFLLFKTKEQISAEHLYKHNTEPMLPPVSVYPLTWFMSVASTPSGQWQEKQTHKETHTCVPQDNVSTSPHDVLSSVTLRLEGKKPSSHLPCTLYNDNNDNVTNPGFIYKYIAGIGKYIYKHRHGQAGVILSSWWNATEPEGRVVNKPSLCLHTDTAGWQRLLGKTKSALFLPRPAHAVILISVLHHFPQWDLVNLCTTLNQSRGMQTVSPSRCFHLAHETAANKWMNSENVLN